jgi:radical SAM superfamily enzyme YgiQ (UPF0313 family)
MKKNLSEKNGKPLNILLVFPKVDYAHVDRKNVKEPLGNIFGEALSLTLPQVAASAQKKHNVSIIDENYEKLNFETDIDIVGITCLTMTAKRAYEIADEYRKRNVKVALGGNHPTALPEEAKQHADSVIIGEAEETWPKLLEDFEKGQLESFYKADKKISPEKIPAPRRDLIKRNFTMDGLLTRRGCPNNCEFCTVTSLFNEEIKPLDNIINEIKSISAKEIFIYDQNLSWDMEYVRKLFNELKKFNKKWLANGTINMLGQNDEFLKLAKEANIYYWYIGFESFSQKSLNGANKKHNQVENYFSAINKIKNHGMIINGSFMFGFDEDTIDIFETTSKKIDELDIDMAEFHIITPFPGTALYNRLKKEDRILTEDWSKYTTANVVFEPKKMTAKELFEGTRKVAKNFYSIKKIIKRSFRALKTTNSINVFFLVILRNLRYRERYKNQFNF